MGGPTPPLDPVARRALDAGLATPDEIAATGTAPPMLEELLVREGILTKGQLAGAPRPASSAQTTGIPPQGEPFGRYVKVSRLGGGGMGEVWKAWDSALGRWVALKFLLQNKPEETARFLREAQLAARLSHPNIAAIYEVGELAGRRYIAMDFSLARAIEGVSVTVSGTIVGTPNFMAPEQARCESVDARADVYSLGAALYEILTGTIPFAADNVYQVIVRLQEREAVPPRRIDPSIDADLETIVLKCMEKDRARRYPTAAELAEDLDRWLEGAAIRARRSTLVYRLRKGFARRRTALATAAGVALVAASPRQRARGRTSTGAASGAVPSSSNSPACPSTPRPGRLRSLAPRGSRLRRGPSRGGPPLPPPRGRPSRAGGLRPRRCRRSGPRDGAPRARPAPHGAL
jgi:hypothetical protein